MKVFAQERLDAMATVGRDYSIPMVVIVSPDQIGRASCRERV